MKTCLRLFDVDSTHYGRSSAHTLMEAPACRSRAATRELFTSEQEGVLQWLPAPRRQGYHSDVGTWRQPSSITKLGRNWRGTRWDLPPPEGLQTSSFPASSRCFCAGFIRPSEPPARHRNYFVFSCVSGLNSLEFSLMLISAETESFSFTWVAAESQKPRNTFAITANTSEEYESLRRWPVGPSAQKIYTTCDFSYSFSCRFWCCCWWCEKYEYLRHGQKQKWQVLLWNLSHHQESQICVLWG